MSYENKMIFSECKNRYFIRELNYGDYNRGYGELMTQLSNDGVPSRIQFCRLCDYLSRSMYHKIDVMIDSHNNILMGSGTIFVEPKVIHRCAKLAHIEDIVIDKHYKKQGLGKYMIEHLIKKAMDHGCYKVRLICRPNVKEFYKKCGFAEDQSGMTFVPSYL